MNDIRIFWKASLRNILCRCFGQRLVARVLLVGTVTLIIAGAERLEAQIMRTNRTLAAQPAPVTELPSTQP
jgi:hypothetical protein